LSNRENTLVFQKIKAIWFSPEMILTSILSSTRFLISLDVLLGMIPEKSFLISVSSTALYSVSRKLSVEANTAVFPESFTSIPARVGRIFPSAVEKSVFSMDCRTTFPESVRLMSSFMLGMSGKSDA
jgi:hypothetical protein